MPTCIKWGERNVKKCTEYRDDGYNDCEEYQDKGYNACSKWDADCCDWWPCSWGCKLITWLCMGWYWVSNVVCVAWYWVSHVVCAVWGIVATAFCVLWDIVVTVVDAVIETIESIVGWVLSAIAFVIELFLTVPIIGRLIAWILAIGESLVWFVFGIIDTVAGLLGIRPEKKLRVCTIILADENGQPLKDQSGNPITAATVVPWLQKAADVYKQEANVRLIPVAPFQYHTGFGDQETVTEDWVHVRTKESSKRILDLGGEAATAGADLIDIGSHYNTIANLECFYGTWRKLIGFGAPITVFVIRSMEEGAGRSLGPLTDYIVIGGSQSIDITTVAHELGHACYLWHVSSGLMASSAPRGTSLDWWQVTIVRSSRHVSYF